MKVPLNIKALSSKYSFVGDPPKYFLEVELLGHRLEIPVSPDVVKSVDAFVADAEKRKKALTKAPYEERREYPQSYDTGVEYDIGAVSFHDAEDDS